MDQADHCMRLLDITDNLILKTNDHVKYTILLQRQFNLLVTPSVHLCQYHIIHQMKKNVSELAHKSEDHIERNHQDGKRRERIYCGLTNVQQSQIS